MNKTIPLGLLLLTALLPLAFNAHAQAPSWQWVKSFGGDFSSNSAQRERIQGNLVLDKHNNTYGATASSYTVIDTSSGHNTANIAIYSYGCDGGTVRWVRYIEAAYSPQVDAFTSDEDGNSYTFGRVLTTNTQIPFLVDTIMTNFTTAGAGHFKLNYIIKLDSNGKRQWVKFHEPWTTNALYSISYGMYDVEDDKQGHLDCLIKSDSGSIISNLIVPKDGYYVLKINKQDGAVISLTKLDITLVNNTSTFYKPKMVSYNGSYYLKLNFIDSTYFGNQLVTNSVPGNSFKYILCKFNNTGNFIWKQEVESNNGINSNFIFPTKLTCINNLIFTPILYSGNPVFQGITLANSWPGVPSSDVYFALDTLNGNVIWHLQENGGANCYSVTSRNNKCYVGIEYENQVYFGNSSDTILPKTTIVNNGNIGIVEIDAISGTYNWSAGTKGNSVNNFPSKIAANDNGAVFVLGEITGGVENSMGILSTNQGHNGQLYLAKIAPNNNCNCTTAIPTMQTISQTNLQIQVSGTANGAVDSLVWYWGDGNSSKYITQGVGISHTYTNAGSYNACLKSYNSCGTKDACKQYSVVTALNNAIIQNVNVYPNPSADNWQIENYNAQMLTIKLYNTSGKILLSKQVNAATNTLLGNNLASGIYYLEISTPNGVKRTQKLVKE